jgi:hypothetical protein
MAAAFVHPGHLQSLRRGLRQLRPRGRRSVHFNGARDELRHAVRYDHMHRHEEPLLWAADAIAWAWQRAGDWRDRVRPLVVQFQEVP